LEKAIDSGNIDDIADMYTENAMIMPNFWKYRSIESGNQRIFGKSDLVKQFISTK